MGDFDLATGGGISGGRRGQRFELLGSVPGTGQRVSVEPGSIGIFRPSDLGDSGLWKLHHTFVHSSHQRRLRLDSEQLNELQGSRASELHSLQEGTEPGVVADLARLQEPYRGSVNAWSSSKAGASAPGS